MSNTVIQLKHSTETGNVPSGLVNGEIAINTVDGKLFYRHPSGTTQSIQNFPGPSGLDGEIQFNDSGNLGSSANLTFNKTTGNLSSRSVHTRSYIEFSDGTRQFTANAGGGGGTVLSVAGATGAVSNTQLLDGIKTVDGSGSGLDADLLDGVSSESFLRSDVYDTFTSLQSTTGINDLTVGGYTNTYNVRASYSESFASQPMATEMWHDLFAFTKHYTTTFETSNGSVWTAATLDRDLFAQKENQSKLIINGTTVVAARWTFTNTAFGSARWLVIGHAWSTPDPNKTILVQSSADGVTWSTKHTSTYSFVAASMFHRLDEYYGDAYLRVTITWNSGGTINLSNIKLLTSRPGDQGRGKESQYPYSWDGNQNITTGNNLYVISTANTVWHAGNDGSGSGLDADLLDGNEASVFMRKTADSNLNMNNLSIANVNNIEFNDPGVNEGLSWSGGNLWRIYESPNNLTNASGNLQIVQDTTRRATFNTSGQLELPIATGTSPLLISSNTVVANLNADLWDGNQFASYLNQAVLTSSSPTFANVTLNVSGTALNKIWSNTDTSPISDLEFKRGTNSTWGADSFTDYRIRSIGGNLVIQSKNNATAVLDLFTIDEANTSLRLSPVGVEQFRVAHTANAVNYVQVTGAATGNATTISTQGSDSSITSNYSSKGPFSQHIFLINGFTSFQISASNGTVVNRLSAQASLTGVAPVLSAQGTDTNIDLALTPKGNGSVLINSSINVTGNIISNNVDVQGETIEATVLTSKALSGISLTLPNSRTYTLTLGSRSFMEVYIDGYKMIRGTDYTETSTTSITPLISIPIGSTIEYRIEK